MKYLLASFCIFLLVAPACICRAQTLSNGDRLGGLVALIEDRQPPERLGAGPHAGRCGTDSAGPKSRDRGCCAARGHGRSACARCRRARRSAVMYRGWGVPLQQPWNYNAAQNMFSISQTLPGRGKRALRTGVAESDVDEAKAELDEVRLEVRVRVHKAFDDMLLAERRDADSRAACGHCAAGH